MRSALVLGIISITSLACSQRRPHGVAVDASGVGEPPPAALPSNATAPAAVLAVAQAAATAWQVEGGGAALGDRVGLLPARSHALGGGEWLVLVPIEQQFGYVTLRVRVGADGRVADAREVAGLPELEVARMPRGLREEEVRIGDLRGTVTWPAGSARVPGVVLIAGSGPQDRDGTVGPNRPFMDLAWGLAAAGIAVLRHDKRSFRADHPTTLADEAADAVAALATLAALERVDADHVFLLGHSLGGVVATRAAAGQRVAGLILAAAPARPLEEALLEQVAYLVRWRGGDDAAVSAELARQRAAVRASREAFWLDVRAHTVAEALRQLPPTLPFLVVQGERDYQTTAVDVRRWRELLGPRPAQFRLYPELDHLLMRGQGMATPKSYGVPGRVERRLIDDVATWVLTR